MVNIVLNGGTMKEHYCPACHVFVAPADRDLHLQGTQRWHRNHWKQYLQQQLTFAFKTGLQIF
jgi:hypothetical protein